MQIIETEFGYEISTPEIIILMGGINAQFSSLKNQYSEFQFTRIKQIHSDAVIETTNAADDYQIIADAHFSKEKNLALCVVTADCVPVFLYDSKNKIVAGIHAGWRGVANKIIPKTVQKLIAQGSSAEQINVVIGPHIQKPSFEVGFDVRDQIICSLGPLSLTEKEQFFEVISDSKVLVDLNQVAQAQLQQSGISNENIFTLHIDTFKDLRFHSHRRDKEKAGRQISFISRKL